MVRWSATWALIPWASPRSRLISSTLVGSELKHGRICMLAIVGMLWQEYGPHWPGAAYETRDIFAAPGSVGFASNIQIFLFMSMLELINFNKHYGEGEPGDLGLDGGMLKYVCRTDQNSPDIRDCSLPSRHDCFHWSFRSVSFVSGKETLVHVGWILLK